MACQRFYRERRTIQHTEYNDIGDSLEDNGGKIASSRRRLAASSGTKNSKDTQEKIFQSELQRTKNRQSGLYNRYRFGLLLKCKNFIQTL